MDITGQGPEAAGQQQDDAGLHDVVQPDSGPAAGEPSAAGDAESFIMPEMNELMSNWQSFFGNHCVPRARAIEAEVANLQYDIGAVTDRAEAEKNEALNELTRLGKLFQNFQNSISQILQFDSFGGAQH